MKRLIVLIAYLMIFALIATVLFFSGYYISGILIIIWMMFTPVFIVQKIFGMLKSALPFISFALFLSLTFDFNASVIGNLILYLSPFLSYILTRDKTKLIHGVMIFHTMYVLIINLFEIPFLQVIKVYVLLVIYLLLFPEHVYVLMKHQLQTIIHKKKA